MAKRIPRLDEITDTTPLRLDVAEMAYRRGAAGRMIITHTGVPPAFEGQGIAARLVDAAVAAAQAEGWKITPLSSYVAARFRRHPEWDDLLA